MPKKSLIRSSRLGPLTCLACPASPSVELLIWRPRVESKSGEAAGKVGTYQNLCRSSWLKNGKLIEILRFRNPANQLRLIVFPIIYRVFYISGGFLAGFQPSTVLLLIFSMLQLYKHQALTLFSARPGILHPIVQAFCQKHMTNFRLRPPQRAGFYTGGAA